MRGSVSPRRSRSPRRETLFHPSSESLQYPPLEAVGDVVADAVRITAIQGMDKQELPVFGDIDGERARCKGYQIGEQRYFEIAIHLELIGDETRLEVHPWRK